MGTTIPENSIKMKHKILAGIFLLLVLSVSYYYVYHSDTYLMAHSKNLQTGSGVEECKKSSDLFTEKYLCKFGYYQVTYPTHKKIFYYWYSRSEIGSTNHTYFLKGVDLNTFKVLNKHYSYDKNNLYHDGQVEQVEGLNLNNIQAVNNHYLKNDSSIFYYSKKLPNVNPSDFRIVNVDYPKGYIAPSPSSDLAYEDSPFGIANNQLFYGNKIMKAFLGKTEVNVDTQSFKILRTQLYLYAKDNNYVYFLPGEYWGGREPGFLEEIGYLHVVSGADPKTFNIKRDYLYGPNTVGEDNAFDINGRVELMK